MKNLHFWYSAKLHAMMTSDGAELNRCAIKVEGETVELEYTHCHGDYIENGGAAWDDCVYLGVGDITFIGKDPILDRMDQEFDDYLSWE